MSGKKEEERAPKRHRSSLEPEDATKLTSSLHDDSADGSTPFMEGTIDIVPDGDVLLELSGIAGVKKGIKLRVSSHILSIGSPVLRADLGRTTPKAAEKTTIPLPKDDGDAMLLLCNILHLQHHKLPPRISAELIYRLAKTAEQYQCITATSRATVTWLDRLFHAKTPVDTFKMIETAFVLDEPIFFSRFTERWVRTDPVANKFVTRNTEPLIRKLALELQNRRHNSLAAVRAEIDLLVDPCSAAFSKSREHYIDYAPGMSSDVDGDGRPLSSICHVDKMAGTTYLGALRDAHIWPATTWPPTLGALLDAVKDFRIPDYDDCDECEFCDGVKEAFERNMMMVRLLHADRLWGICLDCFKAGGVNGGECRIEHAKVKAA